MSETALTTPVNVSGDEGLAVQLPTERFVYGFEGMAEGSFDEKALAILKEPVDPRLVEVKPDGIVYLPWAWYADRLNRAFGQGAWTIVPRKDAQIIGTSVVYFGALFVQKRFIREAAGECEYRANNPNMSYAACYEGAFSDCIVRCCKILGIAKELWDPTWREAWLAEWALKGWAEGKDGKNKPYFYRRDREKPWQIKGAVEPARKPPRDAPRLAEYVPPPKALSQETPTTGQPQPADATPGTPDGPKGQTLTLLPSASGAESEATAAPSTDPSERVPGEDDDEDEGEVSDQTDLVDCWKLVEEGHKKNNTYKCHFEPIGKWPRRRESQHIELQKKRRELGLTDADWKNGLQKYYSKETSKDLADFEADDLLAKLQARWNMRKYKHPDDKARAKEQRSTDTPPEMREMLEEGQ